MGTPTEYLQALRSDHLLDAELAEFERLLAGECEPQMQVQALEHLLRAVHLQPEQVVSLARSQVVRERSGLQLALTRYARSQQYRSSHSTEQARLASRWAEASDLIKAFFLSFP